MGIRRESDSSLALALAFSLSLALSHTQVVFSSKLAADTPMGAVSWGEEEGSKPEPSYLGKQAEAAKAADDTVYLWQPRPLPTWLGQDKEEEKDRHRECMITTSGSFSLGTED